MRRRLGKKMERMMIGFSLLNSFFFFKTLPFTLFISNKSGIILCSINM